MSSPDSVCSELSGELQGEGLRLGAGVILGAGVFDRQGGVVGHRHRKGGGHDVLGQADSRRVVGTLDTDGNARFTTGQVEAITRLEVEGAGLFTGGERIQGAEVFADQGEGAGNDDQAGGQSGDPVVAGAGVSIRPSLSPRSLM